MLVGHATDQEVGSGCTVVLGPPGGMRAAACVRGRATGTRELDALSPQHLVSAVHAILLTGGSAYGLGAADGVMQWLRERGRGFDVGVEVVPIVPAAVIFDLAFGAAQWPTIAHGYRACEQATEVVDEGSVGAGTGATVGKILGREGAMKSGCGTWAEQRDGLVVGSLAVVNALGDVRDLDNNIIAGARTRDGFLDTRRYIAGGGLPGGAFAQQGANTTLVVVATNAALDRTGLVALAAMTADALAQRITPVATQYDGDVVFAVSVGDEAPANAMMVEVMAQDVTGMAIERAVQLAVGTAEVPGLGGGKDRMLDAGS
jgi:L-aminopeptidase/D-esterase-like protein